MTIPRIQQGPAFGAQPRPHRRPVEWPTLEWSKSSPPPAWNFGGLAFFLREVHLAMRTLGSLRIVVSSVIAHARDVRS